VRRSSPRWLAAQLFAAFALAQEEGVIVRPTDGAAVPEGEVIVLAAAPGGRLELDGQPVDAAAPFPNVLHANLSPSAGEHTLALVWEGGRKEIRFFAGANPPETYRLFRPHPPTEVECTQCHGLSRRGRFRFVGGCFNCHKQEQFAGFHQHVPDVLEECGLCHNAHGSTTKAHLTLPRETACKQCHN
jgi:predicted CXXCH cytochrome family protein